MTNETPIYDLKDLSKKLKISIRTLRKYVKSGELKAKKVGKAYYVTEEILSNVVYGIRQRSGLFQYRQQILLL